MEIKQDILDYTFELLSIHQPATIAGTYDGLEAEVTMTFVGDIQTYVEEFTYNGYEYNQFRELVIEAAGRCVARHNTYAGIPSRQPFIDSVTEPE
jgi:hypothetical protein